MERCARPFFMVIGSLLITPFRTRECLVARTLRTLVPVKDEQAKDVKAIGDETVNARVVGVGAMKPAAIFFFVFLGGGRLGGQQRFWN